MKTYKSSCMTLLSMLTIFLLFSPATAAAVNVSGTVYVSSLEANSELKLTESTTLIVDANKTIKNISGDYPLTIQGDKMLIISSGGHGISVKSLHSKANVVISAKKDGLNIDQDILIESGDMLIDVKHDGIYSRHGNIEIRSGYTISSCGTNYSGIYCSEGNVTIGSDAIVDAWGAKYGIYANSGHFTSSGKVKTQAAGWGLIAKTVNINGGSLYSKACGPSIMATSGNVEINGDVETICTYTGANCITANQNVIIRGGKVNADCSSTNGTAIEANKGNIEILGGNVNADGVKYGIYAGNAIIVASDLKARGFWSFWAQNIEIRSPYKILSPEDAVATKYTIVDGAGDWVQNVVIGTKTLSGTVSIDSSTPIPGTFLRYKLGGEVFTLNKNGTKLTAIWQQSKDGENGWTDISLETQYFVKDHEYDTYLRVKISAEGYDGYLFSTPRKVTKSSCYIDAVTPVLTISNGNLLVSNASTSQEYIIFTNQKSTSSLTESDWAKSVTPTSSVFNIGGTKNTINYVYTRVKGNSWMFPGTDIRQASIYYGETTYMQDFQLTVKKVNGISSPTSESLLEEENGYYYTSVSTSSDRLRVTATPIPADATNFSGIRGEMWLMNGYGIESSTYGQNGRFYSDFQCTKEIEADKYYKTVYLKLTRQSNNVQIAAQYMKGYNDLAYHSISFYVADTNGNVLINNLSIATVVTIGKGEVMPDLKLNVYPKKGTLNTLTTRVTDASSPGTAPVITFNSTAQTATIDATNADEGTYFYNIYNNHIGVGSAQVKVVNSLVEEVRMLPESLSLDPGDTYSLSVQLIPANSTSDVTWSSSNTSVATVTSKGIVTVNSNAEIGSTAVITATAAEKTATCKLTVGGEKFDLYVAGIQVTSLNMDKLTELIAEKNDKSMNRYLNDGMEVKFDGVRTLTLKNATIDVENSIAQGMSFGIKNLIVMIEGDCYVNSNNYHGIKLMRSATITGNGTLTVSGGDCGVAFQDGRESPITLHIDGVKLKVAGGKYGMNGGALTYNNALDIDNATVYADGQYGAIDYWYGGISLTNCSITKPTNGMVIEEKIASGSNVATSVIITASGLKGDVNKDGSVDISDIVAVINTIAGNDTYKSTADVNGDSKVDISDIVMIINIVADK